MTEPNMPGYDDLDPEIARDLVAANHILAANGVLDSFGHVSIRDPRNPDRQKALGYSSV